MARERLVRSSNEKIIAGVCGGLAARFDITPREARIIWILLSLLPGPMWILYVILWIILPEEPT